MGFLARLAGLVMGEPAPGNWHTDEPGNGWLSNTFFRSSLVRGGTPIDPAVNRALTISTIYRGVNVLADSVAMLPCMVKEEKEDGSFEPLPKHRISRVLRMPNAYQTHYHLMHMTMAHMLLRGNAYWRIVSEKGQWASSLLPLHPDRVVPWEERNGSIYYMHLPPTGGPEFLEGRTDVIHFRGQTDDGIVGLSLIDLMKRQTDTVVNMEEYGRAYFARSPSLRGIIQSPFRLKREDLEEVQERFREDTTGKRNWFKTKILDRKMEWKPVGVSNEDSQWLAARQWSVPEFARFIGVPVVLLMHTDRSSLYANAGRFFSAFAQFDLAHWLVNIEEELSAVLLPTDEQDSRRVDIDHAMMLRGNALERVKYYEALHKMGVLSAEQIARLERMSKPEKPDPPPVPAGNVAPATNPPPGQQPAEPDDDKGDGK